MALIDWYASRLDVYQDCYHDLRFTLALREHSDPAETLDKLKEILDRTEKRLEEIRHADVH